MGIAGGLVALVVLGYVILGGDSEVGATAGIRDRLTSAGLSAQDCSLRYGATAGEPAGVTAVLVDRSASARGATDAPDYPAALLGEVQKAVGRGDAVVVAGFDGTSATVRWSMTETAFAGDPNRAEAARTDVVDCVGRRIADAARGHPDMPGSDVLGAIGAAQELLAAAPPGHRSLLLATDGLINTGCADLNEVSPGGDVGRVVERCREGLADLPDTDVTILALGDTAAADARPDSGQLEWLKSLWSSLCHQITTGTCSVANTALSDRVDNPLPPGAATDERIVWPVVEQERSGDVVRVSLPDRLLFDTGSDQLHPAAASVLTGVADRVRKVSGTVVEVVGHTDGRGDTEYNDLLSLGRAQRVADALRTSHGLDAPPRGAGERELKCSPETRPDGSPDPVTLQCNRRVEVVIRLGGPT